MSDTNGRLTPAQVEELIRGELATLKIEQDTFKLREWEALEDAADRPVTPWIGAAFPPIWFVRGQLWLALRRKHPTLAYEDLAELDSDLLTEAIGLTKPDEEADGGPDPTPPAAEPAPKPSRASATSGE